MDSTLTNRHVIIAAIVSVAAVAIVAIFFYALGVYARNADAAKQELVQTCVSKGGSWVIDGDTGECWIVTGRLPQNIL